MPFTLVGPCEFREEIRKSRFMTLAAPIASPADAQAFIEQHSDLNATHNCWAWKLGGQYRSNDDGEPGVLQAGQSWQPSRRRNSIKSWCW